MVFPRHKSGRSDEAYIRGYSQGCTATVKQSPSVVSLLSPDKDTRKRIFDILLALGMLLLFAPLMVLIAVLIWRSDGAPILFAHERMGKDGRPFKCFKFRTMVKNSKGMLDQLIEIDTDIRRQCFSSYKLHDDPRIIPGIGRLLRASSLDELPQIFNVLIGDMSLVGPRPVIDGELRKYGPFKHHYMSVKPGLTGLWQLGGRSATSYETRISLDVWYVEHASTLRDLSILLRTAASFLTSRLGRAR